MNKYFYDLHIHSCLSPCGDNDMTPNNIAGMAALKGLNIIALTDHNTCKNCPAFFAACKRNGVIPIAGMELTTAEDIHMVCLFEKLGQAMEFGDEIGKHRMLIENRPDIFGEQLVLDQEDRIVSTDKYLLPNATDLSIEQAAELAASFGAVCYPAHIDRESNGIVSALGAVPESPGFPCVEYRDVNNRNEYEKRFSILESKGVVVSSDAHYLWDINEAENCFELEDEPYSSDLVRKRLLEMLDGKGR